MTRIVGGIATSHAPAVFLDSTRWKEQGERDLTRRDLISPVTGRPVSYEEVAADVQERYGDVELELTPDAFLAKQERMRSASAELRQVIADVAPDVLLIVSDDQQDLFHEDNMPAFSIYWGASWTLLPWEPPGRQSPIERQIQSGWGDQVVEVPVDAELGLHLISWLVDHDFDVSQFRYLRDSYGGSVGPVGQISERRERPPHPQGMPKGYAYVVKGLLDNQPIPMVPVFVNALIPPNQPTVSRCFEFGAALGAALEAFGPARRVLVVASGGLSHLVIDKQLDLSLLAALEAGDAGALASVPDSTAGEARLWVVAAGLCRHLQFRVVDYVPTPRTPAATGGGWAFARWS